MLAGVLDAPRSGRGKVAVLPVRCTTPETLSIAVGFALWWHRQLVAAGLRSKFLFGFPFGEHVPQLKRMFDKYGRGYAEGLMLRHECRWGLFLEFALEESNARAKVHLFEVVAPFPIKAIDQWEYAGDLFDAPKFAYEVVGSAASHLGGGSRHSSWHEAFDSTDEVASVAFLAALGATTLLEECVPDACDAALSALITVYEAAPTMQPAIDLMDDLLRAMVEIDEATDEDLARALHRAREALGRSPPEWEGIEQRARAPAPRD